MKDDLYLRQCQAHAQSALMYVTDLDEEIKFTEHQLRFIQTRLDYLRKQQEIAKRAAVLGELSVANAEKELADGDK